MSKIPQCLVAFILVVAFGYYVVVVYYPSYREGRANAKITSTVDRMLRYAAWRDANPQPGNTFPEESDPFTGEPLLLMDGMAPDSMSWFLVSPGPDGEFQVGDIDSFAISEFIPYDPTNGVFSSGDILFSDGISSALRGNPEGRLGKWKRTYYGYESISDISKTLD